MFFAVREPNADAELVGLPDLLLGGLDDADARALLATVIPGRIDERVRDRIVSETHGNPLALLELPRGLTVAQLAGGFGLPDRMELGGRIEESFLRRFETLPAQTRTLLLVAAAEPLGDPVLVWRAASELGVAVSALEPATPAGLLDVGSHVRFRHPLVRSAVYRSASREERLRVHEALAAATDQDVEPDRCVWHRAQATPDADDEVADELERSAGRAHARGGLAAAAAFLERAAELTTHAERRAQRHLAASQFHLQAGAFDAASASVATARSGPLDELGRARADLLIAGIASAHDRGNEAPQLLLQAAKALEHLDARLSRDTYLDAWCAALFAGGLAQDGGRLADVSNAAVAAPAAPDPPRGSDLLLEGCALIYTQDRDAAVPVLEQAVAAFASAEASAEELMRWGWLATVAATYLWDYDACLALATRGVEVARGSGALEVLAVALNIMSEACAMGGDYVAAGQLVAEADVVREATGTLVGPYGALFLAGFRGIEMEAAPLIEATIRDATPGGQGTVVAFAHYANAVLMNGLCRYEEALASAVAAYEDTPELVVARWALSEWVEAATKTRDEAEAHRAVELLGAHAGGSDSPWAQGLLAQARAQVGSGDEVEPHYRDAVDQLSRVGTRPDLARTRLLYGEWLRREGRRVDAREQLRGAHEEFTLMGAEAFAERARRELLATGEKVRARRSETRDDLTSQEEQIARLARGGLTNPEIGAQLFLSPRTVEWHLHKVFGKLGISSRKGLVDALPETVPV
jgi:DNA-binding CsgD family transcriptional regulator